MNLQSDKNLSMDELLDRNRPLQTKSSTPPTPSIEIHCPVPDAMEELLSRVERLEQLSSWQTNQLRGLTARPTNWATQTQADELLKAVKQLEQMAEQAGKPKEKHFSLPRLRLPRLYLQRPEWPSVVVLLWAAATLVLLLLWFKSGVDWSILSLLTP